MRIRLSLHAKIRNNLCHFEMVSELLFEFCLFQTTCVTLTGPPPPGRNRLSHFPFNVSLTSFLLAAVTQGFHLKTVKYLVMDEEQQ